MDFGGETSFEERDLNIIIFFDKTNDKNLKKMKTCKLCLFPVTWTSLQYILAIEFTVWLGLLNHCLLKNE